MEKRIKEIFQFQRFSPDARLTQMIADVQMRYAQLSDDDLEMVAAAGERSVEQEVELDAGDPFR